MQRKPPAAPDAGAWDAFGPFAELRGFRLAEDGEVFTVRAPIAASDPSVVEEILSTLGMALERRESGPVPEGPLKATAACHRALPYADRVAGTVTFTWQPGQRRVANVEASTPALRACFEQAVAKVGLAAPKKARQVRLSVRIPLQRGVIMRLPGGAATQPQLVIPFEFRGDLLDLAIDPEGPAVRLTKGRSSDDGWSRVGADGTLTELPRKGDDD